MDELLHSLDIDNLELLGSDCKYKAIHSLETGKVIYLPFYPFSLKAEEKEQLLSDMILDGKHKNISYDYQKKNVGGFRKDKNSSSLSPLLKLFMNRYAVFSKELIDSLFPQYQDALIWGRTSYRPAEINGRISSKRKDDTRLHVDSFPATPVNGRRILRVFSNVNPYNQPRVWHLGEPFAQVLSEFASKITNYNPVRAKFLHWIKATKTLRTAYDHYQLHLHDSMKLSDSYQQSVPKQRMDFPAQSTWIVFTDQVSHAALGGQFLLEQTFYLPVESMATPELSPLKLWEKEKSAVLA
ncbi:MAG: Kdo hydroxylase family protein [Tatlockia sp.]|nr:Kdo hydroxylase family protein [Tatlockia sp.]